MAAINAINLEKRKKCYAIKVKTRQDESRTSRTPTDFSLK